MVYPLQGVELKRLSTGIHAILDAMKRTKNFLLHNPLLDFCATHWNSHGYCGIDAFSKVGREILDLLVGITCARCG